VLFLDSYTTRLSDFLLSRTGWFLEFSAGLMVFMGLLFIVGILIWYGVFKILLCCFFSFVVLWCFSFGYRMRVSYKDSVAWARCWDEFDKLMASKGEDDDGEGGEQGLYLFQANGSYYSKVRFYGLTEEYGLAREWTFKVLHPLYQKTGFRWFVIVYSLLGESLIECLGAWLPSVWDWYYSCIHVYLKYLLKVNFTVERVVLCFFLALGSVIYIFVAVPSLVDLGPYDIEFMYV
jgi:hypothetical protein